MTKTTKAVLIAVPLVLVCISVTGITVLIIQLKQAWAPAHVYVGEPAREQIRQEGLWIGNQATNLYYYVDGFQDHTVFLAFSDTRAALNEFIMRKTGHRPETLEKWEGQIRPDDCAYGPGTLCGKDYRTALYDIGRVANGIFFQHWESPHKWYLICDTSQNRLYYCWQNFRYQFEQREPPRAAEPSSAGASEGR